MSIPPSHSVIGLSLSASLPPLAQEEVNMTGLAIPALLPTSFAAGELFCPSPVALDSAASLLPPLHAGATNDAAPPLHLEGRASLLLPNAVAGTLPLPAPLHIGGAVDAAPPLHLEGEVLVPPPPTLGGTLPLPAPLHIGGVVDAAPPLHLKGGVLVPLQLPLDGTVTRRYDWMLAFLVWIGTWGQEFYQNQTRCKNREPHPLETHAEWKARLLANREIAKRELVMAWRAPAPVRIISSDDPEVAHVDQFVRVLLEMCNLNRLMEIYPLNKEGKDVDPPLFDRLLRAYVVYHYTEEALVRPQLENICLPLIV